MLLLLATSIVGLVTISAAGAEERIDVSAILKKSDAEKILGETVKAPTPLNIEAKDGYYSKCNYYGSKSIKCLLLRVRQAAEGSIDPDKEFEQVAATGGGIKVVEDLGDRAGMFNGAPENGLPGNVIMLYVVKGKNFVTVGLGGIKDEGVALEKAKEVARKILAQL